MPDRTYFQDSKEPYAITLAGQTIYVISGPQDVGEILKNTTSVSWHSFVKEVYTRMGISSISIEAMWAQPTGQDKAMSRRLRPAHEMIEEYHRQQLHPGEHFNSLISSKTTPWIDSQLRFDLLQNHTAVQEVGLDFIRVSLWQLCTKLFIEGLTEAYFGKLVWHIRPDLLNSYTTWEQTSWKYMYRLPNFLSQDMCRAKAEIVDTFTSYFKAPKSNREDATFFVTAVENELRGAGLSEEEIAQIIMLHYWA
jgi:hypothetical protein